MNPDHEIHPHQHSVTREARLSRHAQTGAVLWFTGLSGSGKSTIANAVDRRLNEQFQAYTYLLDGDNLRSGLNSDLGFSLEDRRENIRRVAEVAKLFLDAGLIVLTALISPLREERERARQIIEPGRFIEIHVDCPLAICEQRDAKGLYRKAREGKIADFTGIDSPYEIPLHPEIILHSGKDSVEICAQQVINHLQETDVLHGTPAGNTIS